MPALAAMGVRALIEYVMIEHCGDQGSFARNLTTFEAQGYLSKIQREHIGVVLDAGHAAIHRGFTPNAEDLATLLDIAEAMLQVVYLHPESIQHLKTRVPRKRKKMRADTATRTSRRVKGLC